MRCASKLIVILVPAASLFFPVAAQHDDAGYIYDQPEAVFGDWATGTCSDHWVVASTGGRACRLTSSPHGDLKPRPRDVAKIGQLMFHDGVWNGARRLPERWVEASVASSYVFGPGEGFYDFTDYGYLWWRMDAVIGGERLASYTAAGSGGQRLIVTPDLDTIVVFTGGNHDSYEPVDEIMIRHILPTLAGD